MKSKRFLLRLNPDLYEAIEAWAGQEFRSVNGQIEYLLHEALRRRGRHVGAGQDVSGSESRAAREGPEKAPPDAAP